MMNQSKSIRHKQTPAFCRCFFTVLRHSVSTDGYNRSSAERTDGQGLAVAVGPHEKKFFVGDS